MGFGIESSLLPPPVGDPATLVAGRCQPLPPQPRWCFWRFTFLQCQEHLPCDFCSLCHEGVNPDFRQTPGGCILQRQSSG